MDDMKNLAKLLVFGGLLIMLVAFAMLKLGWAGIIGYRATSVATWSADSSLYPPDSVFAYWAQGAFTADPDSMRKLTTSFCEPAGYGKPDTLCAYTVIGAGSFNTSYNPNIVFYWYYGNGRVARDNSPQISHVYSKVDTVDQVLEAIGGSGDGPNEDTLLVYDSATAAVVEGAQVIVESTGGTPKTDWLKTDVTGRVITHLAAADWHVFVNTPFLFQQTTPQVITNAGDQLDTIFVYSWTSTLPLSGDDSCIVNIFTDVPKAKAKIVMHGLAREDRETPIRDTNGVWLDRNEIRPNPVADANGVISVTLVRSAATNPECAYDIEVVNKYNQVVFSIEDYAVPSQNADTLLN